MGPQVFSLFICFLPPFLPSSFHLSPLGGLRARLHSSSSVPNFLKFQFLAPVQENESSEPKNRYTHTQAEWSIHAPVCVSNTIMVKAPHFSSFLCLMCACTYRMFISTLHSVTSSACACCCFSDIAALSPRAECVVGESPLRSQRHSWRQQIFLRVATPQKSAEINGRRKHATYYYF